MPAANMKMRKKKNKQREYIPYDHNAGCDCPGGFDNEHPEKPSKEYLEQLEEDIYLWNLIIENDQELGDTMLLSNDRKSLQACKIEKIRVKKALKMMMREKENEQELRCS